MRCHTDPYLCMHCLMERESAIVIVDILGIVYVYVMLRRAVLGFPRIRLLPEQCRVCAEVLATANLETKCQ